MMLVCLYDASTVKRHQTFHLCLDKIKNSYFVKGKHFLLFFFSLAYIYGWGNRVQLICRNITMRALWGLDVKMPSFGRAVACHYVIYSPSSLNILCSLSCKPYSLQELHRKRRMDQITNSREHEGTRRWTESQTTWKKNCLLLLNSVSSHGRWQGNSIPFFPPLKNITEEKPLLLDNVKSSATHTNNYSSVLFCHVHGMTTVHRRLKKQDNCWTPNLKGPVSDVIYIFRIILITKYVLYREMWFLLITFISTTYILSIPWVCL